MSFSVGKNNNPFSSKPESPTSLSCFEVGDAAVPHLLDGLLLTNFGGKLPPNKTDMEKWKKNTLHITTCNISQHISYNILH